MLEDQQIEGCGWIQRVLKDQQIEGCGWIQRVLEDQLISELVTTEVVGCLKLLIN